MTVPAGVRKIIRRTALMEDPSPMLVRFGEPFTDAVAPSLTDPIDDSWLRLEPVRIDGGLSPVCLHSRLLPRKVGVSAMAVKHITEDDRYVYTVGPFAGHRAVAAFRARQHRRMSLTFIHPDPVPARTRWFDVELSLDVDVASRVQAMFWLDFTAEPVAPHGPYATFVTNPELERTA